MELNSEPIFDNPEGRALETNEYQYVPNNINLEVSSSEGCSKSDQQNQLCAVNGNAVQPQYQIIDVQWQYTPEDINFHSQVIDTKTRINNNSYPVDETFEFSRCTEEEQITTWSQQWGDEVEHYEYETKLPNSDIFVKISNNQMKNTSTTTVPVSIEKLLQVTIAARKTAVAKLVLSMSNIVDLSFIATIKYTSPDKNTSEFKVEGSWRGILYKVSSSNITVCETEIGIM